MKCKKSQSTSSRVKRKFSTIQPISRIRKSSLGSGKTISMSSDHINKMKKDETPSKITDHFSVSTICRRFTKLTTSSKSLVDLEPFPVPVASVTSQSDEDFFYRRRCVIVISQLFSPNIFPGAVSRSFEIFVIF